MSSCFFGVRDVASIAGLLSLLHKLMKDRGFIRACASLCLIVCAEGKRRTNSPEEKCPGVKN